MHLEAHDTAEGRLLALGGRWTVENVSTLEKTVAGAAAASPAAVTIDTAGVEALDLTGAWLLRSLEGRLTAAGTRVSWRPARPEQLAFIDEALKILRE